MKIKSIVPALDGFFAIYANRKTRRLAFRQPVVAWALVEKRLYFVNDADDASNENPNCELRESLEAMAVVPGNGGDAELAYDMYDDDENFLFLGIESPTSKKINVRRECEFHDRMDRLAKQAMKEAEPPKAI